MNDRERGALGARRWVALLVLASACAGNVMSSGGPEASAPSPGEDGATPAATARSDAAAPPLVDGGTMPEPARDGSATSPANDAALRSDASSSPAADAATPSSAPKPAAMSLISVGKPVVTSAGAGAALVNDTYFDLGFWDVAASSKPWATIDLGRGPTRIFVHVYASQGDTIPRAYRLETSGDSSNGRDGSWSVRTTISDNQQASRAHVVDFTGQRWLRITIDQAASSGGRVRLNELAVRDASRGTSDSWIFLGDSVTATTLHPGPDSFAGLVHDAVPTFYPLMINAGVGGTTTSDCLAELDANIAAYPDVQNWAVSYGTNDSASGDAAQAATFGRNLQMIIERLKSAGKSVFVPRIPYKNGSDLTAYNRVLDEVVARTGATPGPDLYAYFAAHKGELYDGVHPNDQGGAAMNRLWSETVLPLYR